MAYFAVAAGRRGLRWQSASKKMSGGLVTQVLAKALDARTETDAGATLLSQNAMLMRMYMGATKWT
jgi:hypothetical protein